MAPKKKKKVLVGMSGGVDSSVTAYLLQKQGYEVIGVYLKFWADPSLHSKKDKKDEKSPYESLEGPEKPRTIAEKLGIPFHVFNFEKPFKKRIVDYFVTGYESGITPNPCVECNRNMKFGVFLEKMHELGADYVATGHYARIIRTSDGSLELHAGKDRTKDQSYFLYTLTQEKLQHILFPIGEYTKEEVRKMAKEYGFNEVNKQGESQNVCFYPDDMQRPFLQKHLPKEALVSGPIVTVDGKTIGEHTGLPNYTIGQRKGLGIGGMKGYEDLEGKGWYVVNFDKGKNALIVGQDKDLLKDQLQAGSLSFVSGKIPTEDMRIEAKIRSRFIRQPAMLSVTKGKAVLSFERPQRAITPGQSVVLYQGDKVLGGGIIE